MENKLCQNVFSVNVLIKALVRGADAAVLEFGEALPVH